ncbi:MAG: TolC family protein [Acidobacteriota bacterium]|jgi:outer membrane protein TolC|nr:TolC family protein [Acidobacteriota bacterium]
MRKRLWVLILLAILAGPVSAGDDMVELTLDQSLKMALENNNAYEIQRQQVRMAKFRLRQSMGFLPSVSLSGAKNLDEKLMVLEMPAMIPGGDPTEVTLDFTMDYEFTFQIVQPVFTGGKIWNAFRNARLDVELSKEKAAAGKDELVLNVTKTFHNLLVLRELENAHREARELAERNLKNVAVRNELGMVPRYDLLRAQLNLRSTEPDLLNVRKLIRITRENLRHAVGLPPGTEVRASGELDYRKLNLDMTELVREALENRTEIRQLELERRKAANMLKMAYAAFLPDMSIVAQYNYRSNAFRFTEGNWNDYYTINLSVSLPIFTGLKRSGQVGELRVLNKSLRLQAEQLDETTRIQIQNLCLTMEQEYQNILSAEKNVETATEGVRIAELNYEEGMITILELNASYNSLTQAKVARLQAIYNYTVAATELEKLTGTRLNGGEQ